MKGVIEVCFRRPFTSQRLTMGLEPVVTAERLCVSGALFNFLSVKEKPAGLGNESANRAQKEEKCALFLIAVGDSSVLTVILTCYFFYKSLYAITKEKWTMHRL